jgi:hypothetical protein
VYVRDPQAGVDSPQEATPRNHQVLLASTDSNDVQRAESQVPSRRRLAGRGRDVLVFAPLVLLVGLFVTLVPTRMNGQVEDNARRRASGLAEVLSNALAVALEFEDADEATRVLTLLGSQKDAISAVVLDGTAARSRTGRPLPDRAACSCRTAPAPTCAAVS